MQAMEKGASSAMVGVIISVTPLAVVVLAPVSGYLVRTSLADDPEFFFFFWGGGGGGVAPYVHTCGMTYKGLMLVLVLT